MACAQVEKVDDASFTVPQVVTVQSIKIDIESINNTIKNLEFRRDDLMAKLIDASAKGVKGATTAVQEIQVATPVQPVTP